MFAAEVAQQIACIASCGYNVSSTIFTENCCLINISFKAKNPLNNRHESFSAQVLLLHVKLVYRTFTVLIFTAQHANVPSRSSCGIRKIHIKRKINTEIEYEPVSRPALLCGLIIHLLVAK